MNTDDVMPIDASARYGEGLDRTLVLGGGGLYFIAWQTAYISAAKEGGVDLSRAERVVGTSAGSLVGSLLCSGRIGHFARLADLFTKAQGLVSFLAPVGELKPSQRRALDLFMEAGDADPATVAAIGHAALAADTPSARTMRRNIGLLVSRSGWPGEEDQLWVTVTDAYSGERVVVRRSTGARPTTAVAASCALPGIYAPQLIADRRCMDGGISGSATHSDLVAGSSRAVVLSVIGDSAPGLLASVADVFAHEVAELRAAGTKAVVRWPQLQEGLNLMDPSAMEAALQAGRAAAQADLEDLRGLWA